MEGRVNAHRRGEEKKPKSFKSIKKKKPSKILHVKLSKSHSLITAGLFSVFRPTEPVECTEKPHWTWLHNRSHCTSLPSCIIWHHVCISNAEHSLRLKRRDKFVFCDKTLLSPDQQISTYCDFQWREGGREGGEVVGMGANPKWLVIVPFEDGTKSAALVEQVCSKMWDFYNGYIRFCKTYTVKDIYTVQWGGYADCLTNSRILWS